MRLCGAEADLTLISAPKGQFVVNGAYLNAVKNVLRDKARDSACSRALSEARFAAPAEEVSRVASNPCGDRSGAPRRRARCHKARRRQFRADASPIPVWPALAATASA